MEVSAFAFALRDTPHHSVHSTPSTAMITIMTTPAPRGTEGWWRVVLYVLRAACESCEHDSTLKPFVAWPSRAQVKQGVHTITYEFADLRGPISYQFSICRRSATADNLRAVRVVNSLCVTITTDAKTDPC